MASIGTSGLIRSIRGSKPSYTVCSGLTREEESARPSPMGTDHLDVPFMRSPCHVFGISCNLHCDFCFSMFVPKNATYHILILTISVRKSSCAYLVVRTRYLPDDEVRDRNWRDSWPPDTHLSLPSCIRVAISCTIWSLWFPACDICASRIPTAVSRGASSDSSFHTSADAYMVEAQVV
jgi:hypothetical protein